MGTIILALKQHDVSDSKNVVPIPDYYTQADPHFKDRTIPDHFTKNTGIEIRNIPAFGLKEFSDNSADYIEKHYRNIVSPVNSDREIISAIYNEENDTTLTITVTNYNRLNISFPDLNKIYVYGRQHLAISSKAQQWRCTRGAQGDALNQFGTAGYLMNGGNDWNWPIIFEHNNKVELVYTSVDRKYNRITPRIKDKSEVFQTTKKTDDIKTTIELTLPKISADNFSRLIQFWKQYTLFNTHLSYTLYYSHQDIPICLQAQQQISKDFKNPVSVYSYTSTELEVLLNDAADKNITVYEALNQIGFRELNQPNRFNDLKEITLKELTPEQVKDIHERLLKSMGPMSRLDRPYDGTTNSRKKALIRRYNEIIPPGQKLDLDKAVYKISSPNSLKDNIYEDEKGNRFVYYFEVLMIPIKNRNAENIVISGINFSTTINNRKYFIGEYANYIVTWTVTRIS